MRLLPKKQVNAELATQRKELIDQGVKMAEKVDVVRETLSKEERALSDFRASSVANVTREIDALLEHKEELRRDISKAESKLTALREPLDAEWIRVQDQAEELASRESILVLYAEQVEERSALISQSLQKISQEEQRVQEKNRMINATLQSTTDNNIRSKKLLAEAQEIKVKAQKEVELRESILSQKEAAIENTQKVLERRWREADARDLEHVEKEKQLEDQRKTLERTLNRLNK